MKILIEYHNKKILATITGDYKVTVSQKDAGLKDVLADDDPIALDQCKECRVWKSEDEELYGDGYCTNCATICSECQCYFNHKEMIPDGDEYICKSCDAKSK
jgi:hypothetical protein